MAGARRDAPPLLANSCMAERAWLMAFGAHVVACGKQQLVVMHQAVMDRMAGRLQMCRCRALGSLRALCLIVSYRRVRGSWVARSNGHWVAGARATAAHQPRRLLNCGCSTEAAVLQCGIGFGGTAPGLPHAWHASCAAAGCGGGRSAGPRRGSKRCCHLMTYRIAAAQSLCRTACPAASLTALPAS